MGGGGGEDGGWGGGFCFTPLPISRFVGGRGRFAVVSPLVLPVPLLIPPSSSLSMCAALAAYRGARVLDPACSPPNGRSASCPRAHCGVSVLVEPPADSCGTCACGPLCRAAAVCCVSPPPPHVTVGTARRTVAARPAPRPRASRATPVVALLTSHCVCWDCSGLFCLGSCPAVPCRRRAPSCPFSPTARRLGARSRVPSDASHRVVSPPAARSPAVALLRPVPMSCWWVHSASGARSADPRSSVPSGSS